MLFNITVACFETDSFSVACYNSLIVEEDKNSLYLTFVAASTFGIFHYCFFVYVFFRQCQDAANPYLAARSTMMAQSMHMRFVMIGARVQKITIHQLQKHTFTCTSHRSQRLKASRELEVAVESEVSSKASSHH